LKKHYYAISYIVFILVLALIVILFDIGDMMWMVLAALALIATSIYTYSTRKKS
jgi:predicted membrane protein